MAEDVVNCAPAAAKEGELYNMKCLKYPEKYFERGLYVCKKLKQLVPEWTDFQIAAQVGVFIDENGCDPQEVNKEEKAGKGNTKGDPDYGAGIGSWTFESVKNIITDLLKLPRGTRIENIPFDDQIKVIERFVHVSGQWYYKYYQAIQRAPTIEDAAIIVCLITAGPGSAPKEYWNAPKIPLIEHVLKAQGIYQKTNDAIYGKSAYHDNLYPRRLAAGREVLRRWTSGG